MRLSRHFVRDMQGWWEAEQHTCGRQGSGRVRAPNYLLIRSAAKGKPTYKTKKIGQE